MSECHVTLKDVDVLYPSRLHNRLSVKEHVFKLLRLQKPRGLLHDIHALRGLSLHVAKGERLGIIGRNGAGKSTLLRVIGGVFPTNRGSVTTRGTVRSLFELSLGFEPDATGRQNIFYRGLLQGEMPADIRSREQEIVEFAGLGEFIDYPVKMYSAGMLVRLAFAISTCSVGEILLLDEVLGAGDAYFFAKARQRITSLIEKASILVFVSHDFGAIRDLCSRAILLDEGRIVDDGQPTAVIDRYMENVKRNSTP